MLRTKIKKNTGFGGQADVRVLKNSLQVHFQESDETFQVSLEGWEEGRAGGLYNIVLTKTNDKIKWIAPPGRSEPYFVRFVEFGNRPNEIPEPKKEDGYEATSRYGGTYWKPDGWVAKIKLEVLDQGDYKGLTIPHKIPYVFVQDPVSGATMLEGTSGQNKKVQEFLRIAGFDFANEDIPFGTNVLPWLEVRLQAALAIFTVTLNEKGWIETLSPAPAFVDLSALLGTNGKNGKKQTKAQARAKEFVEKVVRPKTKLKAKKAA